METGTLIAVILGSIGGVTVLIVIFFLTWRMCSRRLYKCSDYENIIAEHRRLVLAEQSVTDSMKPIPFTVPAQSTPSPGRRPDWKWSAETDHGGGSEPNSPTFRRQYSEGSGVYSIGAIDPSLYKISDEADNYDIPPNHIGRVWFALQYERETEKLLVTLIKARNLPSRSLTSVCNCDPFVRIYLLPDERRYIQSKFRKKTCNPKFEESCVFQVSCRSFLDRVLKFTVLDVDRHKRHQVIGHALYPLREHDITTDDRVVVWRDLEREVSESTSDRGEIQVSLSYNPHVERLTVGIYEGKALKKVDGCSSVDSFAKVSILVQNKSIKTKRTEVVKKEENPTYNESFTFKLPSSNIDGASINISVMQHIGGHKDKIIGRLVLGSFMFARGKELDHWNEMMATPTEQVVHWQFLS